MPSSGLAILAAGMGKDPDGGHGPGLQAGVLEETQRVRVGAPFLPGFSRHSFSALYFSGLRGP